MNPINNHAPSFRSSKIIRYEAVAKASELAKKFESEGKKVPQNMYDILNLAAFGTLPKEIVVPNKEYAEKYGAFNKLCNVVYKV